MIGAVEHSADGVCNIRRGCGWRILQTVSGESLATRKFTGTVARRSSVQQAVAQLPENTKHAGVRLVLGDDRLENAPFPVSLPAARLPRRYARMLRDIEKHIGKARLSSNLAAGAAKLRWHHVGLLGVPIAQASLAQLSNERGAADALMPKRSQVSSYAFLRSKLLHPHRLCKSRAYGDNVLAVCCLRGLRPCTA